MKRAGLILLGVVCLFVLPQHALAQNVQMQCRTLVANDFLQPNEVIVNDQVCHSVASTPVQTTPATPPVQQALKGTPSVSVVSTPLPSSSAGKPQVTMFRHQVLGESWEDFKRITGSKIDPCRSTTPQGLQWCETFKKIEAGQNGTLTDSNPSASVSLVFSDRKLTQVLVVAKADWTKSLTEFTQTYGAPDSQSTNSAAWSFADGGGISAKQMPGKLVHADFYSLEGKPTGDQSESEARQPEDHPLLGLESEPSSMAASQPAAPQSDYLTVDELQKAVQGSGRGITITAGGTVGQAFAASLANVNVAQYASIQLFTTESWIALRAHRARQQYQQFDVNSLSKEETLRGLTVVALGGAFGSTAGPRCNSVTRIALISDKGGEVVAEAVGQEAASSSWSNAFGASASCNALVAKFSTSGVHRVASAAEKGEYFVGVFSGSRMIFMYKVKEKYLKELGH